MTIFELCCEDLLSRIAGLVNCRRCLETFLICREASISKPDEPVEEVAVNILESFSRQPYRLRQKHNNDIFESLKYAGRFAVAQLCSLTQANGLMPEIPKKPGLSLGKMAQLTGFMCIVWLATETLKKSMSWTWS